MVYYSMGTNPGYISGSCSINMVQESPSIPPKCQISYKSLKSQMWLYHLQMLNIHAWASGALHNRHNMHNMHNMWICSACPTQAHPDPAAGEQGAAGGAGGAPGASGVLHGVYRGQPPWLLEPMPCPCTSHSLRGVQIGFLEIKSNLKSNQGVKNYARFWSNRQIKSSNQIVWTPLWVFKSAF